MSKPTRRTFTKQAALAGIATAASYNRVLGANDKVRLGFIGPIGAGNDGRRFPTACAVGYYLPPLRG